MSDENNDYKNITLREWFYEKWIKKLFCLIFILNTINIDDTAINAISGRQNFINNLSFFEWFNLYGKHTLKKYINSIVTFIKNLFKIFIIINFVVFTVIVITQLRQNEYPKQKALLMPAHVITRAYIIPLSNLLGWKNPVILPFYIIRDKLYNVGISKLPENSPEKEVWWYNTKFVEFATIVEPTVSKWFSNRHLPLKRKEIENVYKWHNEVYNHILIYPQIDMSQTIYAKDYLLIYRDMIRSYIHSSDLMSVAQQIRTPLYLKQNNNSPHQKPGPEYTAVKHNIELLKSFETLKEKLKNEDSEAYKKYEKIPIIEEYIFKKKILQSYIKYLQTFEHIDCESEEFQSFFNYELKILNYIVDNCINTDGRTLLRYQAALLTSVNLSTCPKENEIYSNEYEKLTNFFNERYKIYKAKKKNNK